MIADILAEVVLKAGRWVLIDVVVRGVLQGPGYALLRLSKHRDPEFHQDGLALVVGVFAWAAVGLIGMGVYLMVNRGAA